MQAVTSACGGWRFAGHHHLAHGAAASAGEGADRKRADAFKVFVVWVRFGRFRLSVHFSCCTYPTSHRPWNKDRDVLHLYFKIWGNPMRKFKGSFSAVPKPIVLKWILILQCFLDLQELPIFAPLLSSFKLIIVSSNVFQKSIEVRKIIARC